MLRESPAFRLIFQCFIILLLFSFTTGLQAQDRGMISGRVVDASTGEYLPGANVALEGTVMGAASDREGVFVIFNVPEGSYKLVINYIGYSDFSMDVSITSSNFKVMLDEIKMEISAFQADAIVVEGLLEGQIKALNRQRVSSNIKNVVSREQMERFPDENVAEVVKRIPGVFIARDQGEGRYVHIRGTEPRMSTVTVDGEKAVTTRGEERFSSLDIIGANQTAAIEVIKALTPDMDGDAIGGSVNLISRSAFDYAGSRLRATLGGGYGDIVGNPLYQAKVSYSTIVGQNRNIGLTFTANFDRTERGAHNNEFEYTEGEGLNNAVIPYAMEEFDLRDYTVNRNRFGLGAGLEYRIDSNNRIFLRGSWNEFNDDEHRGRWRIRIGDEFLDTEGLVTDRFRPEIESKDRTEKNNMSQVSVGGSNKLGDLGIDYVVNYSYAHERKIPQFETSFRFEDRIGVLVDRSDFDNPKWTLTTEDQDAIYDKSRYEFRDVDFRNQKTKNEDFVGSVHFKYPVNFGSTPAEIKFGGKYRSNTKDKNDDRIAYEWDGPGDLYLSDFGTAKGPDDFLDGNYDYVEFPTEEAVEDFINNNKDNGNLEASTDWWDSEGQTFEAKEKVYAAYAMATINFGQLMILAGVRDEFTAMEYTGTELFFDTGGDFSSFRAVTIKESYNNVLPMIHFRYNLARMTSVRAAITQTLSRPNYWDLAPTFFINQEDDGEIVAGNPQLKATTSLNIDLMGEHYFEGVGILSGGFFFKKLDDVIAVTVRDIDGGVYDGYEEEKPRNIGTADLTGIELNWQQQLTFLPGFFSAFGIYANYTKTWVSSDYAEWADLVFPDAGDAADREAFVKSFEDFLPGQAGDVANFALSFENYGFSARLSMTYQTDFVEEIGPNRDEDVYVDDHFQIDLSASQDLTDNLEAFLELVNLNNRPERTYLGVTERPQQREFYSWWMKLGLKFSM